MNIQNYTCTVEQAKKLRELGVTAKSQYYWVSFGTESGQEIALCRPVNSYEQKPCEWAWYILGEVRQEIQEQIDHDKLNADGVVYPAYTLGELLRMADTETYVQRAGSYTSEYAQWEWVDEGREAANGVYDTPEQASADMLIHLLENKYITPEQCNGALDG